MKLIPVSQHDIIHSLWLFFFSLSIGTRWSLWSFSNLKFHSKFCSVNFPFSTLRGQEERTTPNTATSEQCEFRAGMQITLSSSQSSPGPLCLLLVPGERYHGAIFRSYAQHCVVGQLLNQTQVHRLLFTCHIYDQMASVSKSLKILERL